VSSVCFLKNFKINKNIILPVVSCGWETWSLVLREVGRLRIIENRVLMKILGPKMGRGSMGL